MAANAPLTNGNPLKIHPNLTHYHIPMVLIKRNSYVFSGVVNPNYSNAAGAGGVMNSYPPPYNATTNHPPPYTGSTTSYPNPGQNNAYPSGYPNQLPNNQI